MHIPLIFGLDVNIPPISRETVRGSFPKAPLKNTKKDSSLIFNESIEDDAEIFSLIREKGFNASTSTPPSLKTHCLIFRGLHRKTDAKDAKDAPVLRASESDRGRTKATFWKPLFHTMKSAKRPAN